MKTYVNYHCHSNYSNGIIVDSPITVDDYIKRIKELGHKAYVSTEHGISYGWVEKYLACEKNNIKFIYGVEAYIENEDKKAFHIILIAKNEQGMKGINNALNKAVYINYKNRRPRLTMDIIKENINPNNVVCTTACALGLLREENLSLFMFVKDYFKNNLYLEVMPHNTNYQKVINNLAKKLSSQYNIKLIGATDSHFIYPEQSNERENLIIAKRIQYDDNDEDENGTYMDYPDYNLLFKRFQEQGIFSDKEIEELLELTNTMLDFDDIVLNKDFKIPTIYPNLTRKERCKKFIDLMNNTWDLYKTKIPVKQHSYYLQEIKAELTEWFKCHMEDYGLTTNAILNKARNMGGIITTTARGSASSYITNMLLGFTTVDRIKSKVPLLKERFMTADKIIKSHSCMDIDNNVSDVNIFYKAQKDILGEETNYPLIAFGTLQPKSAFKMLCTAKGNISVDLQNEMSTKIDNYLLDYKHASDENKDDIKLEDYLDKPELSELYNQGKKYFGLVTDIKRHASAFCVAPNNVAELFGLCKTPAGDVVLNLEGKYMDELGYVKLDWLIVQVVDIIDKVYKRIGMPTPTAEELYNLVKDDKETWNIYENGITCCVNQVEQNKTRDKVMRYKPKTVEELCAFIAAIRPAFQSYYKRFENREHFEFGVKELDELLQGEYLDSSWILYQEQIMKLVVWLGFEVKESADLMKAISKKKEDKIKMIKGKFEDKMCEKMILDILNKRRG